MGNVQSPVEHLTWSGERLWPQFEALCAADSTISALVDTAGRSWSRGEIRGMAARVSDQLRSQGIGAGDRVLVAACKSAATAAVALAVSETGAVFCPYSPKIGPAEMQVLEDRLGHIAKVRQTTGGEIGIEPRDRGERSQDPRDPDTVLIGFTSGTTGLPKAVMHGPIALNYVTRACATIAGLAVGEPILGVMPFDSAAGYTFTLHFALSQGNPLVILDKWNAVEAMELARRHGCRWTILVPTQLFTMVEAARLGAWQGRLPLRAASVGGSPISPDLIAEAESWLGVKVLRGYGLSECMSFCRIHLEDPPERRSNFDGRPYPQSEVEAFDPAGAKLPRLQRGEAGVRGPSLFLGYAKGLGAGEERMTPDGFLLTGDEVIRDREGYLRVVGRIKDQIIRGGFNIDPAEVETVLLRHPAIAEVAVVAVPDRKLGEQACAMCRLRPGSPAIDLDCLRDHMAKAGLSRKKWPEHVVIVESMTFLPVGKIDKKAMAAKAREELARRAAA